MVIRVVEFSSRVYKVERCLPKNQHTQRELLNSKNWVNGELSLPDYESTYFLCLHAPLRRRKFWCARAWSRLHCVATTYYITYFLRSAKISIEWDSSGFTLISKNWIRFLYLKPGAILWNQISLLLFLNQTRYRHEKFGLPNFFWYFVSISTSIWQLESR